MYLNQLDAHLNKALASVYLVSGDVPLLVQETRDKIRAKAKQNGYSEYELLTVERGFDWGQFSVSARSMSLFGDKTILDIRNASAKFDQRASKMLIEYLEAPPTDKLLIITTDKLTSAQKKTKWHKAISKAGETLDIWPIKTHELPQWIMQRMRATELNTDMESARLLAELTEGNLLASQQAIEKLRLLFPDTRIGCNEVAAAASDNARFNVFDLVNEALLGHSARTIRILDNLRGEGTEPILILWALTREIRSLLQLCFERDNGTPLSQLLAKQWASRQAMLKVALNKHDQHSLMQLLQYASQVDKSIKGLQSGNAWDGLLNLSMTLSGQPSPLLKMELHNA